MASRTKAAEPATLADVRAWAAKKGIEVGRRGKIRAEVLEQFTKDTKRSVA